MAKAFELNAQLRTDRGKAMNRRARRLQQTVPAIIYGADEAPQSVNLLHKDLSLMLANEATYSHILKVHLGEETQQVVLKAVQRHPYKPQILHVDFFRIRADEKITMNVPLHFIGEERCVGMKAGGVLAKLMTDVEISCLPANLPEFLELDISNLEIDQSLHLSDIQLPSGVEFTTPLDEEHNLSVVSLRIPRAEKEVTPEEAAAPVEEVKEEAEGKEGKEAKE